MKNIIFNYKSLNVIDDIYKSLNSGNIDSHSHRYYVSMLKLITDLINQQNKKKSESEENTFKGAFMNCKLKNNEIQEMKTHLSDDKPYEQQNEDFQKRSLNPDTGKKSNLNTQNKKYPYLPYPDEILTESLVKELERLRGIIRRSNKRHPASIDPLSDRNHFITGDDYIFEGMFQQEIKDRMNDKQEEIYSLISMGYNLREISEITAMPYITLRRIFKNIKKIVKSVLIDE